MAIATATRAATAVTTASRARARASRPRRVMPSVRSTGNSAESRVSWRLSSWPMTASATRPVSAANRASVMACGRIARWVAVISSARLVALTPWVRG